MTPSAPRRSQASRQAILTAAFDLTAEVGYAKLTIEAIAARAGVGKQTIYRWWPSKGAVLLDAFLMLSQPEEDDDTPAGLPDTGDLAADLKLTLRATVDEFNNPRYDVPLRALTAELQHDTALAATYATTLEEPVKKMKRVRFRAAQAAGQLPADLDLDIAIDMVFGPLQSRWLLRSGPLDHKFADAVVDAALTGLQKR